MSRSGMARPPGGRQTSSSPWLHRAANATEALASFGTESKISFPTGLMSPARTHKSTEQQIREKFSSLFYIDRPTLEREITDFLTYPANVWSDPNKRLKYLLGKLEDAVASTPRRQTRSATTLARTQSAQNFQEVLDDPRPPDSPSMSVKHGPKISAAEFGRIELPMPMSQPTGLVSANTSFSSHASFWSNARNSSQSAGTPASSMGTPMEIDGACGKSTPDSEFPMSSMTAEAFREALNEVQAGRNETAVDSPSSYKTPFESPSDYKSPLGSGSSSGRKRSREVDDSPFAPGRATKAQAMEMPPPAFSSPQQPPASAAEVQTPPRTPAAGQAQASLPSPAKSPAVDHRVRDIPVHGLSSIELPPSLLRLRFDLRLEAYRVLQTGKILPGALEMQWRTPRTMENLHELTDRLGIQYQHGFKTDFSDATLCARLRWGEDSKGPLLRLEFLPPRKERSSELQRKWGSTRFLYVDSVDPGRPPKGISGKDVRERFVQMLTNEHSLLGNKYKLFFAREEKRKKGSANAGMYRFDFFAVSGKNLSTVSRSQFLDSHLHFRENADQLSGKLFSRIELLSSRTFEGPSISDKQIAFLPDIFASDHPDDDQFNKPALSHLFSDTVDNTVVMNDGTAAISAFAMRSLCKTLDHKGPLPSLVQGRFRGAKGTWALERSKNQFRDDEDPPEKLISITPSQTKIHRSAMSDDDFSTFNVNRFNMSAKPSVLYSGFLPILQHGGVSADIIHEHVRKSVNMLMDSFEEGLKTPSQFRQWLFVQNEIHQTANRELGIETVAGFPVLMSEKIYQMLESGFEPTKCRFLADEIATLMKGVFNLKMKNFKIPCARSTSLMGTVDTSGLVKPGEVHINFSNTFVDAVSGERSSSWHGMAALVARNPARRPSDIRKLRIVCHPDLSHLTDVAVFSSLGPQPEGSKMQGGDYDGDTYWICVESRIVDSFQNSPAPRESDLPDISELLIEKDGALVRDIISIPESDGAALDEDDVEEWIRSNLLRRFQYNLLGTVTLKLEALTYQENNIASARAEHLNNLLDYLIDAPKRCLTFDYAAWQKFQQKYDIPRDLAKPAHRQFTSLDEESGITFAQDWNPKNIIDQVYFEVLCPEATKAMERVYRIMDDASVHDDQLTGYFRQRQSELADGSPLRKEVDGLPARFEEVAHAWSIGQSKAFLMKEQSKRIECVMECRKLYDEIQPLSICEGSERWSIPTGNGAETHWDVLKASAFAVRCCRERRWKRMMFTVAGDELCRLKASSGPTRLLREPAYFALKASKYKAFATCPGAEGETSEGEEDDDYPMDEDLFDDVAVVAG